MARGRADGPGGRAPLVIRAGADRGEYYDALSASDEGNILPLYQLFATVIRRTVKAMARPGYTHDFLENRLLVSVSDQYRAWRSAVENFEQRLRERLASRGWGLLAQGMPDINSFQLLSEHNPDGNGWFAVVTDPSGRRRFLLWFGYSSDRLCDLLSSTPAGTGYPSLFVSERDDSPDAPHPYRAWCTLPGLPDEVSVKPLEAGPVSMRREFDVQSYSTEKAAEVLAGAFAGQ